MPARTLSEEIHLVLNRGELIYLIQVMRGSEVIRIF